MNKILVVSSLPKEVGGKTEGGVAHVSWNLIKEFKKNNIDVDILPKLFDYKKSVLTNVIKIEYRLKNIILAIKLISRQLMYRDFTFRNGFHLYRSLLMLLSVDKFDEYDLILVHHITNQVVLAKELLNIKTPVFVIIHSHHHYAFLNKKSRKRQIKNVNNQLSYADGVIYVSNTLREQGKRFGVNHHVNEVVIHNGINIYNKIDYLRQKSDDIIFVGSFIPRKGIYALVQALNKSECEIQKVHWVGTGELDSFIKRELNDSGFENNFYENISNVDVMKLINKSKALVVPSKMESFGLVYIEALSMGIPVVGYHEVINEFKNAINQDGKIGNKYLEYMYGFDHETECIIDLMNKINKCISIYDNTTIRFRDKISIKIKKEFNWEAKSLKYLDFFRSSLN